MIPERIRRSLNAGAVVGLAMITVFALVGCAFAGAENATMAKEPVHGDVAGTGSDQAKQPTAKELTGSEKGDSAKEKDSKSTPKWVCEATKVTLEPIWAGEPLKAKWVIKNTGDADLKIKLKGG